MYGNFFWLYLLSVGRVLSENFKFVRGGKLVWIRVLIIIDTGTNNSRLAAMLRQLAQFYAKEPNSLFMVRIAQGLTHMGKGTLTLCPYHSDRQLLNPVAIGGIIATLVAFLDTKTCTYSFSV